MSRSSAVAAMSSKSRIGTTTTVQKSRMSRPSRASSEQCGVPGCALADASPSKVSSQRELATRSCTRIQRVIQSVVEMGMY